MYALIGCWLVYLVGWLVVDGGWCMRRVLVRAETDGDGWDGLGMCGWEERDLWGRYGRYGRYGREGWGWVVGWWVWEGGEGMGGEGMVMVMVMRVGIEVCI